jgi:hypothetical protein
MQKSDNERLTKHQNRRYPFGHRLCGKMPAPFKSAVKLALRRVGLENSA